MNAYILIVEENSEAAIEQSTVLEQKGFIVKTASTGAEALEIIATSGVRPDLLLMENKLPDMSGVDLLRKLNEIGLDTPSVMVTGTGSETVAVEAMKLGAMDYVIKNKETLKRLPGICTEVIEKYHLEQENIRLLDQLKAVNKRLTAANQKLEELSRTDDLTKVFNRRYLMEQFEQECLRTKRYGHALSFALLDIDDFKLINDRRGHVVGDEVLSEYALVLSEHLRRTDILGRYGGEEFGVIFTHTPQEKALQVCNEISRLMKRHRFGSCEAQITVSIGVAYLEKDMQVKELIEMADKSMYKAKERGKDQVVSLQNEQ